MTFEEWWDVTGTTATPDTYKGREESCRQAWDAGQKAEREAGKAAISETLLKPAANIDDRKCYRKAMAALERSNASLSSGRDHD